MKKAISNLVPKAEACCPNQLDYIKMLKLSDKFNKTENLIMQSVANYMKKKKIKCKH